VPNDPFRKVATMFPRGPAQVHTDAALFPAGIGVQAKQELAVLPEDLARALFITGRVPYDQAKHGRSSAYEWCHRVAVLPAYLSWSDDPVRRSARGYVPGIFPQSGLLQG
jgi:hypothetical protein